MKTSVHIILILSLPLMLLSCDKEQKKQAFRLNAGVEEVAVKTVLGSKESGKYPVLWSEGDVISINGLRQSTLSKTETAE